MKRFIFYTILLINNKIFSDSPFGSEKVVTGMAENEIPVLANPMKFNRPSGPIERTAKVYFMPYCSGSEDITPLSSNTVA